jgi:CelD/BcsL family acetyltransferase involved in cellulose biosynthesis
MVDDWRRLAHRSESPFMTAEWLNCWWHAFGRGEPTWLLLSETDGSLAAGAFLEARGNNLTSAANVHSGAWDVVSRDEDARAQLWQALGELPARCLRLHGIPEQAGGADAAEVALQRAGYRVVRDNRPPSPWLGLPTTWEELIQSVSRNLRSQWRRRRRALEREGALTFRTVTRPAELAPALADFLRLEASGWKGRESTAILSNPRTEQFYRAFAQAAAQQGWLRLHLLELDGQLIAGDYGCSFAGTGFLIKTAFSESHERFSPGLVLRGMVLQAAIEEGLGSYDFLGGPERYKLAWASELRPRARLFAYRGSALPRYVYRSRIHPLLWPTIGPIARRARDQARAAFRQASSR